MLIRTIKSSVVLIIGPFLISTHSTSFQLSRTWSYSVISFMLGPNLKKIRFLLDPIIKFSNPTRDTLSAEPILIFIIIIIGSRWTPAVEYRLPVSMRRVMSISRTFITKLLLMIISSCGKSGSINRRWFWAVILLLVFSIHINICNYK